MSVLRGENGLILKPLKLNANPTYSQVMKGTNTSSQSNLIPVCQDELGFYERLQSSTSPDDLKLKTLLPKFHGVHQEKYATQSESGFCVTGLRVYHVETGCLVTELRPDECKRLTTAQVFEGRGRPNQSCGDLEGLEAAAAT
ncbi:putative Inositol polyphosphate multikinase beta-like, partial [Homarus americanus]